MLHRAHQIIPATKTINNINAMLQADQGARYRGLLGQVLPHIGDAYRTDDKPFRPHLGASGLGNECARAIWYGFRWFTRPKFAGRLLRLFNRGHLEEGRFIALLLMIGCELYQQDQYGKQYRISFAEGHAGGSGDGVVIGCPDLPAGTAALTEFKTHNDKSFKKLQIEGVRESKFEHYVQMQVYMRKMGLAVALYMAVNKNDDDLYGEIIMLDPDFADQFIGRGTELVWMEEPPRKMNNSAGFWKCRWCDHRPVCHLQAKPDTNCRTCQSSQPRAGKVWWCCQHSKELTVDEQIEGCKGHIPRVYN